MKTYTKGFTRLELLFVLLAIAIVAFPAVSLLASNKPGSQRAVCFNNLRQIGRGFLMWASDHGDRFPFATEWQAGGALGHPLAGNTWFQFNLISAYLDSPRFLVCPADLETSKVADSWGAQPNGFLNAEYRNNALSYFIALHGQPYSGRSILSGDRNIQASGLSSCSLLPGGELCQQLTPGDSTVQWTNAIHGAVGHLLFADGSIHFVNSSNLQKAVRNDEDDDNGSGVHLLSK